MSNTFDPDAPITNLPTTMTNVEPWQILYTKRKMRVGELLAQGMSAREITDKLNEEGFVTSHGKAITWRIVSKDILWLNAQWLLHAQKAIIDHKSAILQKVAWAQRFAASTQDLKGFLAALKMEIEVTGAASPTIIGFEAVTPERIEEIRRNRWESAAHALKAAGIERDDDARAVQTDGAKTDAE